MVAKGQFQQTKNPRDVMLLYLVRCFIQRSPFLCVVCAGHEQKDDVVAAAQDEGRHQGLRIHGS